MRDDKKARPFLKWAGGKRQLLPELKKRVPWSFNRYFEPFVGGGAFFYFLGHKNAVLSDTNRELIYTYVAVRDEVEALISILKTHVYEKEYYYKIRAIDPMSVSLVEQAARMIYLNKTCFNGLYRVNKKGEFNVSFGRYTDPTICQSDVLRACSRALKNVSIEHRSFEQVLGYAREGDFVYFDPPYIPVSGTANFTAYQKNGFGMSNQSILAGVFDELTNRRVHAVLSNSNVPWVHERYSDYTIAEVNANRCINSNARQRTGAKEVIISNENQV